jgi:hypothetical protein
MSDGVVMWDFDGTLATPRGLWSTCLLEVLDERVPGHRAARDELRAALRDGAQAIGIPALLIRTEGGEPDALAAARLVIAS